MEGTDCAVKTYRRVTRRCEKCGWFLCSVTSLEGSGEAEFEIETRCGNRKCKRKDKFVLLAQDKNNVDTNGVTE